MKLLTSHKFGNIFFSIINVDQGGLVHQIRQNGPKILILIGKTLFEFNEAEFSVVFLIYWRYFYGLNVYLGERAHLGHIFQLKWPQLLNSKTTRFYFHTVEVRLSDTKFLCQELIVN